MIEKISGEVFKPITNALDLIAADIEREIVNFTTKVTAEADIIVMEVLSVSPLVKLCLVLLSCILFITLCKMCLESYYSISQRHVRLQADLDLSETLSDLSQSVSSSSSGDGTHSNTIPIVIIVPVDKTTMMDHSQLSRILRNVPNSVVKQSAITMMPGGENGKSKATFV